MIQHTSGIHDVPENDYHGDRRSLSVSGAKVLLDCPARYRWQQDNPVHKDEYDFGHVAHELILGKGAGYRVLDFDSWRSKDAREAKEQAHADGVAPILTAEHERATALADAVKAHPTAAAILANGHAEKAIYAEHADTGVLLRGRADWLTRKADGTPVVVDVKTTVSAAPKNIDRAMADYGYAMQAAWYTDLLALNGTPDASFIFLFVEKTAPHFVTLATPSDDALEWGRAKNEKAIRLYAECANTDTWPGYPTHEANVPAWAWKDIDEA